jgi:pyruvate dehydrogenase E2 component (dihydrolipoamide acetyltransferase)
MAYDVKLPDIGEGVAEGEIVRWLVKAGDAVKEDQPLVEVMTDKASVEIPAPRTGTIEAIHVEEGAMVPVGTVIVSIAVAGASAPAPAMSGHGHAAPAAAGSAAPAVAAPASSGAPAKVEATPAVRALAKQLGIALETVKGTGPHGRITADEGGILQVATNPAAPGQTSDVRHDTIKTRQVSPTSLMPPGLINAMNADEVADLLAYILSGGDKRGKMFKK